jgi:two-component sensor histidine kinase
MNCRKSDLGGKEGSGRNLLVEPEVLLNRSDATGTARIMIATNNTIPDSIGPSRSGRLWYLIISIICIYAVIGLAILPIAANAGPEIPGVTPLFVGVVLVTELATSFLLLVRFIEARTWSLLVLGCTYLFSGLMPLAHLLTFPGAVLAHQPMIGTSQSTAWIFLLWLSVYSLLALVSVTLEASSNQPRIARENVRPAIVIGSAASVLMVIGSLVAATVMVDQLPSLMASSSWTIFNRTLNYLAIAMLGCGIVMILLVIRDRDELFLWLALALTAMAVANILSAVSGGRYTTGWSVGRLSWVVSACVLFLFFMRLFARQQRLLERRVAERTAELQDSNEQLQRALADRELLMREQQHRSKNLLAVVQSIISRTFSSTHSLAEIKDALQGRLRALASAHSGMLDGEHSGADLAEIVNAEVAVFSERTSARGPRIRLAPQAAQMFALIVHELATNATKHGALSSAQGRVTVVWSLDKSSPPILRFRWQERGGPIVTAPQQIGFGRTIVEDLVSQEFRTIPRIDYAPEGLTYELDVEQSRLQKQS